MQHVYEVCNALFNAMMNVANALRNTVNAIENNYSVLESISNGLKNVVTHFQCLFQRICNAFLGSYALHTDP